MRPFESPHFHRTLWPVLLVLLASACGRSAPSEPAVTRGQLPLPEATEKEKKTNDPKPPEPTSWAAHDVGALEAACQEGQADACTELGRRQRQGGGTDASAVTFQRACDLGSADGCGELGFLKLEGLGIAQDGNTAVALLKRACNDGAARACSRLAAHHLRAGADGRALAAGLSEQGCEGGDPLGCFNLALMLARADGITQDLSRAAKLYRKACEGDIAQACRQLGMAYAAGEGVRADARQAAAFSIRACDLGDAAGCGNAGINYQRGLGIKANPMRASRYFKRACDLGDARYCELLERFRSAAEQPGVVTTPVPKAPIGR